MIDTITIEAFDTQFENLSIRIHLIEIEQYESVTDSIMLKSTPFTSVWENVSHSFMVNDLHLAGKIFLLLKNQSEGDKTGLFITFQFNITAKDELDTANVFTKSLQFLFGWVTDYVKANDIKGNDELSFIVPAFLYSKEQFQEYFPPPLS